MTSTQLPAFAQVDAALDEVLHARVAAMAQPAGIERCLLLAELAEVEAAWWEELSERCRTRVHWRAALTAREHARHNARHWREQATTQAPATPHSEQASEAK